MLEQFGLSPEAEAVYLAKLAQPAAGPAELAAGLGLSESDVDDALMELTRYSLVRPPTESRPHHSELHPVSPALALDAILARRTAEVLRQQQEIERARGALAGVIAELDARMEARARTVARNPPVGEEIIGHGGARQALERLAFESKHEVLTFAPTGTAPDPASLTVIDPLTDYLLGKGVRVRMISVWSARNNAATGPHVRRLVELGAELRTVPALPTSMVVVDQSRVVLPLHSGGVAAGASIHSNVAVVAVMCALFEQYWQAATWWVDGRLTSRTGSQATPSDQERVLLDLLVLGNTDEQAARRLGVSTRTVGRMTADLMRRLGARSRFEAGALAVLHGWIKSYHNDGERLSA